ncbi:hypothetical protein I3842_16G057700 [Carya illinoinensis]|uniref:Uncharacterized protein n=1 Tax=Carya illinoinensis TaxID=32201 RepID=A0A922A5N2_CARIL|nr:hypothetical protein I3842_16G057700 [Carya illinoinensis]
MALDEASDKGDVPTTLMNGNKKSSLDDSVKGSDRRGIGLYNEDGCSELKVHEAQYKASLENVAQISTKNSNENKQFDADDLEKQNEAAENGADGFDFHNTPNEDYDDIGHGKGDHLDVEIQKMLVTLWSHLIFLTMVTRIGMWLRWRKCQPIHMKTLLCTCKILKLSMEDSLQEHSQIPRGKQSAANILVKFLFS